MFKITQFKYITSGHDQKAQMAAQEDLITAFMKNIEVSKYNRAQVNLEQIKMAITNPLLMLASTTRAFQHLMGNLDDETLIKISAKCGVLINSDMSNLVPESFSPAVIQWAYEELGLIEHLQQIQNSVNKAMRSNKK